MKLNRLLEITMILLNQKMITAKQLAERFGVSVRTIYRDIDVLSSAGVPVYMNKGKGGGIMLLDQFALSRTLITEQESESLLVALKTMQAVDYPQTEGVLEKLGALFQMQADDWVHIDFTRWGSRPDESRKFADLKRSILYRHAVSIEYVQADGSRCQRVVEPQRLEYKGQAWYIRGYCRLRKEIRLFRLSRIRHWQVLEERFERLPLGKQTEEQARSTQHDIQLKLHFQPEAVRRLYDEFDDDQIEKQADGTYRVEIAWPENEWLYSYILSYGPLAKVLEPQAVRLLVADRIKQALQQYE